MVKDITNAMTVDVEDYFHVSAFASHIDRSDWNSRELRVEANTRRLLRMFSDADIRGTFFVLGWVAERVPELVREIDDAGHEVACHGWSHELVHNQTPDVFADETRRAKATIEDAIGKSVRGYRAASYSITRRSLWALDILADLGFEYDSSIFPVRHDLYGIVGVPRFPYLMQTQSGRELVEFPLTTLKIGRATLPIAGGGYFRLLPYAATRAAFNRVNRAEGMPFVFYLHPWEIDPQQPRVKASLVSRFRHYQNLHRTEQRLRRLLEDFRFARVSDVIAGLDLSDKPARVAATQEVLVDAA